MTDLENPFPGARIFFLPETESTMRDARDLASRGLPTGTLVAAGRQTAGRGRFPHRTWEDAPGKSLLFTVFFRLRDLSSPPDPVPLRAGLALAETLESFLGLEPRIKWPNDVLLGGRKVSGILAELRDGCVFLGMGVNCGQEEFPEPLREKAVSLRQAAGREVAPRELLPPLLRELLSFRDGKGDWREGVEARLFLRGESIRFLPGLPGSEPVEGRLEGIGEDGSLLLRPSGAAEPRSFAAGEILLGGDSTRRGRSRAVFPPEERKF